MKCLVHVHLLTSADTQEFQLGMYLEVELLGWKVNIFSAFLVLTDGFVVHTSNSSG
jgi:hypothetical protein